MVKLMMPPSTLKRSNDVHDWAEARRIGAILTEGNRTLGVDDHLMGPATCIFWSAVAIGALVKGSPVESVRAVCALSLARLLCKSLLSTLVGIPFHSRSPAMHVNNINGVCRHVYSCD